MKLAQINLPQDKSPLRKAEPQASEIIALDDRILRCAVLDEAGRVLSYEEPEKGKSAALPPDYRMTVKALLMQGVSEELPKELGSVRFTTVVTDKYRLVTLNLADHVVMFTVPLSVPVENICEQALEKFGNDSK